MKIYGLPLSPASLKTWYTANYLGFKYEVISVNLREGENQSEKYLKLHPAGKVPVLDDDGFILWESVAIIRYLARKAKSSLYPAEIKEQALVDQWTDFGSIHIQNGMGRVMFNKLIAPMIKAEVDEASMKCGLEFLNRFVPIVDARLGKHKYLAGEKITVADLNMLAHLDPAEAIAFDLSKFSSLTRWRDALRKQDFYQKVHKVYGESMLAGNQSKR